ncbi:MAG TPA: hypothetical protein VFD03_03080 [Clostridia bacterium]|nr:hypothetical protein [Clostridia bacterium]
MNESEGRIELVDCSTLTKNVMIAKQIYEKILSLQRSNELRSVVYHTNGKLCLYEEEGFGYISVSDLKYFIREFEISFNELCWIFEAMGYKTKKSVIITYNCDKSGTQVEAWQVVL